MDWSVIGARIRQQREYMGYTREQFAELIDVTPKFCSDIELGIKGMSVSTLCKISKTLRLSTDHILFGQGRQSATEPFTLMLDRCSVAERTYAEQLLKTFVMAMDSKKEVV